MGRLRTSSIVIVLTASTGLLACSQQQATEPQQGQMAAPNDRGTAASPETTRDPAVTPGEMSQPPSVENEPDSPDATPPPSVEPDTEDDAPPTPKPIQQR